MSRTRTKVRQSSGNVFADLKLPDANAHMLTAQIVAELYRLTQARKLSQTRAGEVMGISQPEVSRLFKGHFREYSIDRLITFLTAFNQDVVISVQPRASSRMKGDAELTTHQVAVLLNVSRPFVIKLIQSGELPHRMVGTRRRIPIDAVLAYKQRVDKASDAAMDELVRQAQHLAMGY
ncbi:XRE family transcriptional regulator [Hyphomicrobium sp.]|uniref:XRE family transcriptional regulator n=1 Tax=Hyphomicrobium sp. TaxID=82 RepID=UPI002FE3D985